MPSLGRQVVNAVYRATFRPAHTLHTPCMLNTFPSSKLRVFIYQAQICYRWGDQSCTSTAVMAVETHEQATIGGCHDIHDLDAQADWHGMCAHKSKAYIWRSSSLLCAKCARAHIIY